MPQVGWAHSSSIRIGFPQAFVLLPDGMQSSRLPLFALHAYLRCLDLSGLSKIHRCGFGFLIFGTEHERHSVQLYIPPDRQRRCRCRRVNSTLCLKLLAITGFATPAKPLIRRARLGVPVATARPPCSARKSSQFTHLRKLTIQRTASVQKVPLQSSPF